MAVLGAAVARAQPSPPSPPQPQPVIGALQGGPPGYPATIGIPLLPQARSGVVASADTLSPAAANPAPAPPDTGVAGVTTSSGSLAPMPLPPRG